jgi:hypothetical protein
MLCFELTDAAFPIKLTQNKKTRLFTVIYGKQIQAPLSYERAAMALGAAIMHAAACDGKLDNT